VLLLLRTIASLGAALLSRLQRGQCELDQEIMGGFPVPAAFAIGVLLDTFIEGFHAGDYFTPDTPDNHFSHRGALAAGRCRQTLTAWGLSDAGDHIRNEWPPCASQGSFRTRT
jgi:hypothetical protein